MKLFKTIILAAVGFVIGIICSFLFYEFVVVELDIQDSYKVIMFALAAGFLSFGYAVSTQLRCLTILTLPEFWSTAGKRSLQATVLILTLSGPIANISDNTESIVHLVTCFKDLTINITLLSKELLMGPVHHLLMDIKTQEVESQNRYNLTGLSAIVKPLEEEVGDQRETDELQDENDEMDVMLGHVERSKEFEVEQQALALIEHEEGHGGESAGEKIEAIYRKKLAMRCESIFTKGTDSCIIMFADKYDECYENVTQYFGWLLCWPFKLDFLCDLIAMFAQTRLCDVTNLIPPGFGTSYLAIKNGIEDFSQKFKVKVDYQALAHLINIDSFKQTEEELIAQFARTRAYIEYYLDLLKKVLTLTFLLMIFNAIEYHGKYFERLSFDNNYITSYFIRVDKRRKQEERSNILPLKKYEHSEFSTVFRLRLRNRELTKFIFSFLMLVIQLLVVLVIYGFDYVYTKMLVLVKKHVNINITQSGSHALEFGITGTGFVAKLMRDIIKDVNVSTSIDVVHVVEPCLPRPHHLHPSYMNRTLILFAVLVVIIYVEAFSLRTRHSIGNFFYPLRSKERIRWLYNEMLRKRSSVLVHLKEKVLDNGSTFYEKFDWNVMLTCVDVFPRLCCCLKWFKSSRPKCVLCMEYGGFYKCPKCEFWYCYQCWLDVDHRCLYCIARRELEDQMYERIEDEIARV